MSAEMPKEYTELTLEEIEYDGGLSTEDIILIVYGSAMAITFFTGIGVAIHRYRQDNAFVGPNGERRSHLDVAREIFRDRDLDEAPDTLRIHAVDHGQMYNDFVNHGL